MEKLKSDAISWQLIITRTSTAATKSGMLQVYQVIKVDGVESTFQNIEIAIRIYLFMMPTNCTGERTFSKRKLIENQLRSCMLQPRLNALSVISIESDMVKQIDFAEVVKDFSELKARKRCF